MTSANFAQSTQHSQDPGQEQRSVDIARPLEQLQARRRRRRAWILGAIATGFVALLGLTALMYTHSPGDVPPERIGGEYLP